jgi:hypothetical protein
MIYILSCYVKWGIEIFNSGPIIFQCIPDFMSYLYYHGQKTLDHTVTSYRVTVTNTGSTQ